MQKFEQHIAEKLQDLSDKVLYVACSGGLDSICLTHALHSLGFDTRVVHVNYQLRGEDSEEDARFVEAFCEQHGIEFQKRTVDLAEQLQDGGNLQELARDYRYQWFKEIIDADKKNCVVLAHHADDQVETFFLNLARKSGVMGLACMPFENKGIYRPLLDFTKAQLKAYAEQSSLDWREDISNASNKYRRNLLRNEILPSVLNQVQGLDTSVLLIIEQFQRKQKELESTVAPLVESVFKDQALAIDQFTKLDSFEKIELARQLGQPASIALELVKLISSQKGKKVEFIQNENSEFNYVIRERETLSFIPSAQKNMPKPTLVIEQTTTLPTSYSKETIYLDANIIQGELKLRTWKLGDRISPLGVKGTKLISDIIAEAYVPACEKEHVLVLHDDAHIHWCVGLKIGSKAIASDSSQQILKCSVTFPESQE